MPITCTRNNSTRRWRRSTRPASFSPAALNRTPLYGSYSANPDSASDFIMRALSYGQDQRWKRRLVDLAAPRPGARALDLATGTGDIAFALAARGARVVGLDITFRMIELARNRQTGGARGFRPGGGRAPEKLALRFLVGDMHAIPFPAGSFDIVTTGYGLRNVPDLTMAIDEIARVLTPAGQVLTLHFHRPSHRLARSAYPAYLTLVCVAL